ncbi:hypothetical protein [Kitasatospora sp. SUK 42]|uniref:AAA family ATPase n=1 Tax=Kitasatospora sp. SUK 42 TaxID=1588882 RepID=UPI0035AB91B9
MSDGYRTVAALVVDILRQLHDTYGALRVERDSGHPVVTVPGVVITDGIDAHRHVSWQKRTGGRLMQHFPLVQFLVTTHSPYIWLPRSSGRTCTTGWCSAAATTRRCPSSSASTPRTRSARTRPGRCWSRRR